MAEDERKQQEEDREEDLELDADSADAVRGGSSAAVGKAKVALKTDAAFDTYMKG